MLVHRSAVGVVVHTPAKLNLYFEVLGRRDDGFHEIETLMAPIALYDTLTFEADPTGGMVFECRDRRYGSTGPDRSEAKPDVLPIGERNLAVRAVELLRRRVAVRQGARMGLVKRIPIAAGLGGGSSDAAAALVAANAVWRLNRPLSELKEIAGELGSDVPFFLHDGPAVCRGRGERIEPVAARGGAMAFVVVRPPEGLSTAEVYGNCRVADEPRRIDTIQRFFGEGNWTRVGQLLFNRLQHPARGLSAWIPLLEDALSREDCLGHLMSGSGSCYFGLCRHMRHARRVAGRLRATGLGTAFAVRASR